MRSARSGIGRKESTPRADSDRLNMEAIGANRQAPSEASRSLRVRLDEQQLRAPRQQEPHAIAVGQKARRGSWTVRERAGQEGPRDWIEERDPALTIDEVRRENQLRS